MTAIPGVMASDAIRLSVPGLPQYVGVVRLAVAGLANQLDFPFDEAEDLKLAVTEVCSYVLRSARFRVGLQIDFHFSGDTLEIGVCSRVVEPRQAADPAGLGDFGMDVDLDVGVSLVEALMDRLELETDDETGEVTVTISRRFPSIDAR